MSASTLLVTGGSGFLGGALLRTLVPLNRYVLRTASRRQAADLPSSVQTFPIEGLTPQQDWRQALSGVDIVVHAAARVHVMEESSRNPLAEFRLVNVDGTMNLAQQAAQAGVRRFIYISSVKVNGENTAPGVAFTANDPASPADPYGLSKHEAEQALAEFVASTEMELVIIRPVLVYGPGVKANFLTMIRWLERGVPLPFGAVDNKRSLVSLDNLIDLIVTCFDHPGAANQTFLASDGADVSTTELLRKISHALNKPARLISFPVVLMRFGAKLVGKDALAQRLFGSLQVDISKNRQLLGWVPPFSLDHGIRTTVQSYLESQSQ
ncbi:MULTISPECIES: SDR family oxidoreductase [Pseudomonas]|uniref:UDP-glucose 4-epimerase family protein n=1 Tax=Pseudomonas TaxID=286 RepID=UPI000A1F930F|nr:MULTISPECIES: SDR family oxidoreductase [Pseudomonas]MCX4219521.1 SDR family oxidoreductase [Pseudomonas sp. MCal1]UDI91404.1 SDR family oxidoreductase [Pseudomonas sp. IAC-BECa141]UIN54926.1 SDR family oxidoreductase [Pseudomonas kribbensis]